MFFFHVGRGSNGQFSSDQQEAVTIINYVRLDSILLRFVFSFLILRTSVPNCKLSKQMLYNIFIY